MEVMKLGNEVVKVGHGVGVTREVSCKHLEFAVASADEHVLHEDPLSSIGTLSSMKNLEDAYAIEDQFINDKSNDDEPGKLNVEAEVVSMVTVPIYQASSSVTPLFKPVIDLSPPKPASTTTQTPILIATTMTTTYTHLFISLLVQDLRCNACWTNPLVNLPSNCVVNGSSR
ncbi:hypothetical protein Tco_1189635 [Tanacetum coccineum]